MMMFPLHNLRLPSAELLGQIQIQLPWWSCSPCWVLGIRMQVEENTWGEILFHLLLFWIVHTTAYQTNTNIIQPESILENKVWLAFSMYQISITAHRIPKKMKVKRCSDQEHWSLQEVSARKYLEIHNNKRLPPLLFKSVWLIYWVLLMTELVLCPYWLCQTFGLFSFWGPMRINSFSNFRLPWLILLCLNFISLGVLQKQVG